MTNSVGLSARYARISRKMAYEHREWDNEFAEQSDEATETALDLLHARVSQRCLESDLEPVFHMGVPVAYIRKFDSRLQIEMLRAYRPDRFKTSGEGPTIDARGSVFILTEKERHKLQEIHKIVIAEEEAEATDTRVSERHEQLMTSDAPPALTYPDSAMPASASDQRNSEG